MILTLKFTIKIFIMSCQKWHTSIKNQNNFKNCCINELTNYRLLMYCSLYKEIVKGNWLIQFHQFQI